MWKQFSRVRYSVCNTYLNIQIFVRVNWFRCVLARVHAIARLSEQRLHTWKYHIQANKRLIKVKEKWSTITFDVSVLSFIFFFPMYQTISVINRSGACYFLHSSNQWHVWWCVHIQLHVSNTKRLCHFRLNLSLVLLIKVMIIKKHLMLFFSYLKCRYNFLTWVFLVFLFFILYFIWTILSEKGRGRLKTGFLKST